MSRGLIDLTGRTFGKLHVIRLHEIVRTPGETRPYWLCKCSCKRHIRVRGDVLRDGRKKDCGCNTTRQHFKKTVFEINGISKTVTQWARAYGILPRHIYDRLRYGMDVELAVTAPVGRPGHSIRKKSFARSAVADTTSRQDDNH